MPLPEVQNPVEDMRSVAEGPTRARPVRSQDLAGWPCRRLLPQKRCIGQGKAYYGNQKDWTTCRGTAGELEVSTIHRSYGFPADCPLS
mmetsp:Transcript_15197/g.33399  ORF Transcript_15197/g.33399 Transcript_15197/m.33399 type:complete len:88 (-) Transcript_15197:492-755(-)